MLTTGLVSSDENRQHDDGNNNDDINTSGDEFVYQESLENLTETDALDPLVADKVHVEDASEAYGLNRLFFRRLRLLFALGFPNWCSGNMLRFWLVLVLIIGTAYVQIAMLNPHLGQFEVAIRDKRLDDFKSQISSALSLVLGMSLLMTFTTYLSQSIAIEWRKKLTRVFHRLYFRKLVSYTLISLDKRVDNPDQRMSSSIQDFTHEFIHFSLGSFINPFSSLLINVVTAAISLAAMAQQGGNIPLLIAAGLFVLFTFSLYFLFTSISRLTFQQDKYEGDFRYVHHRTAEGAESIACYQGEQREHVAAAASFDFVFYNMKRLIGRRAVLCLVKSTVFNFTQVGGLIMAYVLAESGQRKFDKLTDLQTFQVTVSTGFNALLMLPIMLAFFSPVSGNAHRLGQMLEVSHQLSSSSPLNAKRLAAKSDDQDTSDEEDDEDNHEDMDCDRILDGAQLDDSSSSSFSSQSCDEVPTVNKTRTLSPVSAQDRATDSSSSNSSGSGADNCMRNIGNFIATAGVKLTENLVQIALRSVDVMVPGSGHTLLYDVCFSVDIGHSLLITGPSGCGKSSLLRVVAGLWKAHSGCIERPLDIGRGGVFFVPQRPYITQGSLREQVVYPADATEAPHSDFEIIAIIDSVGLLYLYQQHGLDTVVVWEDVLSLGEQQRMGFARTFFHRPLFAIMDEATSALDEALEHKCLARCLALGITLVSVAHRPAVAAFHTQELAIAVDAVSGARSYSVGPLSLGGERGGAVFTARVPGDQFDVMHDEEVRKKLGEKENKKEKDDVLKNELYAEAQVEVDEEEANKANGKNEIILTDEDKARVEQSGYGFKVFSRLYYLLSLGFPKWSVFFVVLFSVAAAACTTFMQIKQADLLSALLDGDYVTAKDYLLLVSALVAGNTVFANLVLWLGNLGCLSWRQLLLSRMHNMYFRSRVPYLVSMSRGEGGVDNMAQRMTVDLHALTELWAQFWTGDLDGSFFGLLPVLMQIGFLIYQIQSYGWFPQSSTIAFSFVTVFILQFFLSKIAKYTFEIKLVEGTFRTFHARMRTYCESVAFYAGERRERHRASFLYKNVYLTWKKWLLAYGVVQVFVNWICFAILAMAYIVVGIGTFYFNIFPDLDTLSKADKTKEVTLAVTRMVALVQALQMMPRCVGLFGKLAGLIHRIAEASLVMDYWQEKLLLAGEPRAPTGVVALRGPPLKQFLLQQQRERQRQAVLCDKERSSYQVRDRPFIELEGVTAYALGEAPQSDQGGGRKGEKGEKVSSFQESCWRITKPQQARPLFTQLSLRVREVGDSLVITGPSGCGKSSLLRVIAGLWTPVSGTVSRPFLLGEGGIFFLPQRPFVTNGSLASEMVYPHDWPVQGGGGGVSVSVLEDILDSVNLTFLYKKWTLHKPADWADMLSAGELQRLGFARLFFHRPKFALLDESTSAMDLPLERQCLERCIALCITMISVAHRPSVMAFHHQRLELDMHGHHHVQRTTSPPPFPPPSATTPAHA